ncbi:ABC transporter permease [Aureimonas flava]|uniref:ABC transporter permease n=1 Tax=Aureimonas flava TaxID=2320271 RepID=A0A3A1WW58_9HYPH|nr:ABC transporter permease [Aureimonas flava]RIY03252.1 ABC transporter permease [Aureimonas flava]
MLDAYEDSRLSFLALRCVAALVLAFLILPTLVVVPISFSASNLMEFPPRAFSLRWYENFFGSATWMEALRTSLLLGGLTAVLAVPVSFSACIGMDRLGRRFTGPMFAFVLMPSFVPGILLAIGIYFVLARLGLIGTLFGVLLGHVALAIPVAAIVLMPAVRRFDWNQVQAARSLGAGWMRSIKDVVLPQMGFTLVAAALLAFLTSLDEAVISIFVSGGANSTLTKVMFLSLRDQIDPTIAAISVLWSALVVIVVLAIGLRRPV